MLTLLDKQIQNTIHWESLQQPVHGASQQADSLRLLAALDDGWQIQEAASYLAHGRNAENCGYLLTLYHPQRKLTRELSMIHSLSLDALLVFEGVPGINS